MSYEPFNPKPADEAFVEETASVGTVNNAELPQSSNSGDEAASETVNASEARKQPKKRKSQKAVAEDIQRIEALYLGNKGLPDQAIALKLGLDVDNVKKVMANLLRKPDFPRFPETFGVVMPFGLLALAKSKLGELTGRLIDSTTPLKVDYLENEKALRISLYED